MHSHLLPGIDDGVKTYEEAVDLVRAMHDLGLKKIITTPHIIADYYPNTPEGIRLKLEELKKHVANAGIEIELAAAAEYLVDENFVHKLEAKEELLTLGGNFVLVETPFLNKPIFLEEVFFTLKSRGYEPVLAHPERYVYLQEDKRALADLINSQIHLQVNMSSLVGYYSKKARKLAEHLIDSHRVSFLGSDIHHNRHFQAYSKAIQTKYFDRCRQLYLLNNSL